MISSKSRSPHLTAFADTDFSTGQKTDWLKQATLTLRLASGVQVRAGRMYVAGCWLLPPPYAQETVNSPRLPYGFDAYALQVETHTHGWHIIADVSSRTGLDFVSAEQFGSLESSLHAERDIGKVTLGISLQVGDKFGRASLNYSAHPLTWLDLRGLVYTGHDVSSPPSWGGYNYIGIRPFPHLPKLEVHGQADYQTPNSSPLIMTEGLRWTLDHRTGRYSVTTDARQSDSLLFRFQAVF